MKTDTYKPIHPGAILRDEIKSVGVTIQDVADAIGVQRTNLSLLVNGHASLSTEMAVRISECLGKSPEFWLNLQMHYDVKMIDRKALNVKRLKG